MTDNPKEIAVLLTLGYEVKDVWRGSEGAYIGFQNIIKAFEAVEAYENDKLSLNPKALLENLTKAQELIY